MGFPEGFNTRYGDTVKEADLEGASGVYRDSAKQDSER